MSSSKLLPFETIRKAVDGDTEALLQIIHHFEPLIDQMSMRTHINSNGQEICQLDEDLKQEIIIELIQKQSRFRFLRDADEADM